MQLLPNGCRIGKMTVHPKEWETTTKISCDWYFSYRFYDDSFSDKYPKGRQVFVKGMNDNFNLKQRREITKGLIKLELNKLINEGYNPITKKIQKSITLRVPNGDIGFTEALELSYSLIQAAEKTKVNVNSTLGFFKKSIVDLGYNELKISEVKRFHIRMAIDNQEKFKKVWSTNQYNVTRKYLSMLFSGLVELEILEYNPITDLNKRKHIQKGRRVLNEEEKKTINGKLKSENYRLWLFSKIFFHSGARIAEFRRLQLKHIDLNKQTVIFIVLKRNQPCEIEKPIKSVAIKYWLEWIGNNNNPEDYFLGKELKVDSQPCREERITKLWKKIAKKKLGIENDFYSLKHTNTDELSEMIGIENAMKLNSHTNTKTTEIYAVNEKKRQNEIIKNIDNDF